MRHKYSDTPQNIEWLPVLLQSLLYAPLIIYTLLPWKWSPCFQPLDFYEVRKWDDFVSPQFANFLGWWRRHPGTRGSYLEKKKEKYLHLWWADLSFQNSLFISINHLCLIIWFCCSALCSLAKEHSVIVAIEDCCFPIKGRGNRNKPHFTWVIHIWWSFPSYFNGALTIWG